MYLAFPYITFSCSLRSIPTHTQAHLTSMINIFNVSLPFFLIILATYVVDNICRNNLQARLGADLTLRG